MDWSNFKDIYKFRQTIKNSTNQTDINEAKKKEKELLSDSKLFDLTNDGKVDIEDLISFSTEKAIDLDDADGITEDEENFFVEMKNALYDKLAKEINKNEDLKVDDMLELEKTIRGLNSTQKEAAGDFLEKLQNRMVSNLTSQFFVTKETDSYKENAISGAIEIWEAQYQLDEMNESKNNPFNDKFESLLEKLENRVVRTLSQDYTEASIKDAKALKNADALVKKSDSSEEEEKDPFKFSFEEKVLYYDGKKYTGTYSKKYYQDGVICDGVANNGKYYENGVLGNGVYPNPENTGSFFVIDGQIMWQDLLDSPLTKNTKREVYESYIIKDEDGKVKQDAVVSSIVTFVGTIDANKDDVYGIIDNKVNYKDGKKVSTETYGYNSDGSYSKQIHYEDEREDEYIMYTSTGEIFDGNGVYADRLFKNFELDITDQVYGNRLYIGGTLAKGEILFTDGVLYKNGEKLTGISTLNGKYYEDGIIKAVATDEKGIVYRYGSIAQGIIEEDGKYNYYENGKKVSEADEKVGKFIAENFIENVKFEKENNEYNYNSFTGMQVVDSLWRPVEYSFTDENKFEQTVTYVDGATPIKLAIKYENGVPVKAEYDINGTKREVNVNGSKSDTGIDYSLQYAEIDRVINTVQVSNAIGDNLTYVYTYTSDNAGTFGLSGVKIVIGSINDMQSRRVLTEYNLSVDGNDILEIKDDNDNITAIKVIDSSLSGVKVEQTFGLDGKVTTGLVTFKNPAEGASSTITINAGEICKINKGKVVVTVPQKDESGNIVSYLVTTYKADGTKDGKPVEITDKNGTTKSFTEKINIDISEVQDIEIDKDGNVVKIKFEGEEFAVTYPKKDGKDTILLKSDDIEKQFLNNVVIYEKAPSFAGDVTIERTETGVQTKYKVEFKDENGHITGFTEYDYDKETGIMSKSVYKNSEEQKATTFAPDGKTVLNTEIIEFNEDGSEKSVKKYAGTVEDNKVTYEKAFTETGYEEINYSLTTGTVTDKTVTTNAVAATEDTEATPKTVEVITYKSNGTVEDTKTVTTYKLDNEDEIASIVKSEKRNEKYLTIEKTDFTENGKTVEKYSYGSVTDDVIQTTKDSYNTKGLIVSTIITDNANENKLAKRILYENGMKYLVETVKTYDENGMPKTSEVEEFRGGNLRVRALERTYTDFVNNKFTNKVNEVITEVNGVKIKDEQLKFAESIGLAITDIEYNDDGSLKTLAGMRFNDNRVSIYTDWSVNAYGQYSYIEEITLAGNGTEQTGDDVTVITRVDNNVQQYARIVVAGKSYPINVNGAEINGTLDYSIVDNLINDDYADYIYVGDVLFDGLVRKRVFEHKNDDYELTQSIVISSLENANDSTKTVPEIVLPTGKDITLSNNNTTVTVPLTDGNKVPIKLKGADAYNISLEEGETFTISKDGNGIKIQSSYKSGNKTVTTMYSFNEDGGYNKTITENDTEITYTYGADGSTLKSMTIGGFVIDNPSSIDENSVSVNKAYDSTNEKLGYELTYALKKSDEHNIGDLLNGGKIKFKDNKELTLGNNDKATLSADGKSCAVITKVSDSLTVTKTYDLNKNITSVKLNDVEIDTTSCEIKFVNSSNTEVSDLSQAEKLVVSTEATTEKIGYSYEYALKASGNVKIGDKTATKVKFVSSAGINDITQSENVTATVSSDGKSCTVVEKINDNLTVTKTISADGTYTALKINDKTINFGEKAKTIVVDENNITITVEDSKSKIKQLFVYS
ncbi:hypothetical protein IJS77_02100 [bacterium]|nr:hypothetical protein [bacterium]